MSSKTSSLAEDFRALGLFISPTCNVCAKKVSKEIPLDDFDFDETGEDVGVTVAGVAACADCWRKCLTDLADALSALPPSLRAATMESGEGMETLIETVVATARVKRIKEGE